MNETKIDWATRSWNPVTGCLHNCPYCYARNQARRFGLKYAPRIGDPGMEGACKYDSEEGMDTMLELVKPYEKDGRQQPYPMGFLPTFHRYRLSDPAAMKKPQRIFVGSMTDLFGDWVPDLWIKAVLDACEAAPWHTYLFLTKNPRRYGDLATMGLLPKRDNFWYGTTVTEEGMPFFGGSVLHNTFLSIEPLMGPLNAGLGSFGPARWIIVGAMTGPGKEKHRPRREWVENIVEAAAITHAAVFMKDNLTEVWGPDLIQDHPAGMLWPEVG